MEELEGLEPFQSLELNQLMSCLSLGPSGGLPWLSLHPAGHEGCPRAKHFSLWNTRWLLHDLASLYKEICQDNSDDDCSLGSTGSFCHLSTSFSPLLFAMHAGSFGVWAYEPCEGEVPEKREKDILNRLSVLFPTYISLFSL